MLGVVRNSPSPSGVALGGGRDGGVLKMPPGPPLERGPRMDLRFCSFRLNKNINRQLGGTLKMHCGMPPQNRLWEAISKYAVGN